MEFVSIFVPNLLHPYFNQHLMKVINLHGLICEEFFNLIPYLPGYKFATTFAGPYICQPLQISWSDLKSVIRHKRWQSQLFNYFQLFWLWSCGKNAEKKITDLSSTLFLVHYFNTCLKTETTLYLWWALTGSRTTL